VFHRSLDGFRGMGGATNLKNGGPGGVDAKFSGLCIPPERHPLSRHRTKWDAILKCPRGGMVKILVWGKMRASRPQALGRGPRGGLWGFCTTVLGARNFFHG